MTEDDSRPTWFPMPFASNVQDASEQMIETQQDMMRQFVEAGGVNPFEEFRGFGPMDLGTATFKARVQSGGRISIPDAEREALDIQEGDIVQTIVVPVKRNRED